MFGVIMPLCNRMFCCIFGWYFYIEIRLKCEKNILLSSSRAFSLSNPMENSAVCQLSSFFIVYPCGKQWGYMEKSCKMQQNEMNLELVSEFFFVYSTSWSNQNSPKSTFCTFSFQKTYRITIFYDQLNWKTTKKRQQYEVVYNPKFCRIFT